MQVERVTYGDQPGATKITVDRDEKPAPGDSRADRKRKFFVLMHKRWETAKNARKDWDTNAIDDELFEAGSLSPSDSTHWDKAKLNEYHLLGKPALTINKTPQYVHQITAQARANRPTGTVIPVDDKADVETAEVLQGIGRNIEARSDADVAFVTAAEAAARIGWGWVKVIAEYVGDDTFDQDLTIKRMLFPRAFYHDPSAVEFDLSDMRYGFEILRLGRDQFRDEYERDAPEPDTFKDLNLDVQLEDWAPEGRATVMHYWWFDYVADRLFEFVDGQKKLLSTLSAAPKASEVKRNRPVRRRTIKHAIVSGVDILEGEEKPVEADEEWEPVDGIEWPGQRIPYFPCVGEERPIGDKVDRRGVVRDQKDPARAYDFWTSKLTEKIGDELKRPPIVDIRTIAPFKAIWDARNVGNYAYLPVNLENPDDPTKPLPGPAAFPSGDAAGISAIVMAIRQADADQQSTAGFYDPSLGKRESMNQSGVAIARLQQQSGQAASFYQSNLARCVRSVWKELVWLIPKFYDAARIVRILGLDNERAVIVHAGADKAPTPDQVAAFYAAQGISPEAAQKVKHVFDVGSGQYDVMVSTEASYADQRQRDLETLGALWKADPALAPLSADIAVENTELRKKQTLIKRLRASNPALAENSQEPQVPPALLMQVQAMQQAIQKLQMERAAKVLDLQSRERIEAARLVSAEKRTAMTTQASLDATAAKLSVQQALDAIARDHALLHQHLDQYHEVLMSQLPPPELPAPSDEPAGQPALSAEPSAPPGV